MTVCSYHCAMTILTAQSSFICRASWIIHPYILPPFSVWKCETNVCSCGYNYVTVPLLPSVRIWFIQTPFHCNLCFALYVVFFFFHTPVFFTCSAFILLSVSFHQSCCNLQHSFSQFCLRTEINSHICTAKMMIKLNQIKLTLI